MRSIDFNLVMNTLLSVKPARELTSGHILNIVQDFNEGVEFDYLVTRLYLLNVVVDVNNVKALMWKLISKGLIELTIDLKLKFIRKNN